MHYHKKTIVFTCLMSIVVMMGAFIAPQEAPTYKNLKVLPKNISKEDLDKVMDGFKTALGVKCNFCHASRIDDPKKMDFASDAKAEKKTARLMMVMTNKINKKYFHIKDSEQAKGIMAVSCITCHNGNEEPRTKM